MPTDTPVVTVDNDPSIDSGLFSDPLGTEGIVSATVEQVLALAAQKMIADGFPADLPSLRVPTSAADATNLLPQNQGTGVEDRIVQNQHGVSSGIVPGTPVLVTETILKKHFKDPTVAGRIEQLREDVKSWNSGGPRPGASPVAVLLGRLAVLGQHAEASGAIVGTITAKDLVNGGTTTSVGGMYGAVQGAAPGGFEPGVANQLEQLEQLAAQLVGADRDPAPSDTTTTELAVPPATSELAISSTRPAFAATRVSEELATTPTAAQVGTRNSRLGQPADQPVTVVAASEVVSSEHLGVNQNAGPSSQAEQRVSAQLNITVTGGENGIDPRTEIALNRIASNPTLMHLLSNAGFAGADGQSVQLVPDEVHFAAEVAVKAAEQIRSCVLPIAARAQRFATVQKILAGEIASLLATANTVEMPLDIASPIETEFVEAEMPLDIAPTNETEVVEVVHRNTTPVSDGNRQESARTSADGGTYQPVTTVMDVDSSQTPASRDTSPVLIELTSGQIAQLMAVQQELEATAAAYANATAALNQATEQLIAAAVVTALQGRCLGTSDLYRSTLPYPGPALSNQSGLFRADRQYSMN